MGWFGNKTGVFECRRYNKSEIKSKYIFYETGVFTIL